jgi:hypothetical protein
MPARARWAVHPIHAIRSFLRRVLVGIGSRLLLHSRERGFDLVVFSGERYAVTFFVKIRAALDMIAMADPKRFSRIQQSLRRFALVESGGDFYDHDLRAYIVDLPSMVARSVEEVAMTIVHESTHARIRDFGINRLPTNEERIERACVRQEIAFATRLPASTVLAERAEQKLQRAWWSQEMMIRRDVLMLRSIGVPSVIISFRQWLRSKPVRRRTTTNVTARVMRPIEQESHKRGLIRGGVSLFTPPDALELVARARNEGIRIRGIDGFFLRDKQTEPSMADSVDLTAGGDVQGDCWHRAERFLQERLGSGMHFEIVLD